VNTVYEQTGPTKFFCREMCAEWGVLIGFGVKDHLKTTDRNVNISTLHPQASGGLLAGITAITNCPWCGEWIEACRRKRN